MKGVLVSLNFALSLLGLSIDTNRSPIWAVLVVFLWFAASTWLLRVAYHKGWMKQIEEILNKY
jgi:hypothetical protein